VWEAREAVLRCKKGVMDPGLLANDEEAELIKMCSWRLRQFLGTDQNLDDLIRYMLDIEDDAKTKQYVVSYVRSSVDADRFQEEKVNSFAAKLVAQRRKVRALRKQAADRIRRPAAAPIEGYKAYRKGDNEPDDGLFYADQKTSNKPKLSKKERRAEREMQKQEQEFEEYLASRRMCDCQAAKHGLIGNCLQCGKISCQKEGEGPCLFCGADPREEWMPTDSSEATALQKATERRDRLLDFEKNRSERTVVLDDQEDYFTYEENRWLSDAERESIRKQAEEYKRQKEESKHKISFTIDLANRQLVAESNEVADFKPVVEHKKEGPVLKVVHQKVSGGQRSFTNPFLTRKAPVFVEKKPKKNGQKGGAHAAEPDGGEGVKPTKVQHAFFSDTS